ncbi:MAG: NHLP bacteriocin export ABC transporter permease/ATPase subunit [Caldilineaceae bacterium]
MPRCRPRCGPARSTLAALTQQLQERLDFRQSVVTDGAARLARVLDVGRAPAESAVAGPADSDLLRVCRLIGDVMGLEFVPPIEAERDLANRDELDQIAFASRVQSAGCVWPISGGRRTTVPSGHHHRRHAGRPAPKIAHPLPHGQGRRHERAVTADVAKTLQPDAYVFYAKFGDEPVSTREMVRFSLKGMRSDLIMIGLMGLAMALLGLLIPIATGWIVHTLIPNNQRSELLIIGAALVMAAVATMLFSIVQQFAILRFQTKSTGALAAAIWDRLLSLPVDFFRGYTAGDLASRAYGINNIRQLLSDATITAMVSGVFSLVNFGLLFYLSPALALVALLLALIIVGVSVGTSYYQLRFQRQTTQLQGEVSGLVLQLLTGISKIRIAGAEDTAFGVWSDGYAKQQHYAYAAGTVDNLLAFFKSAFPLISSMAIFASIALWLGGNTFSVSVFVSFNVAFSQFLSASLKQVQAFTGVLNAVPYFERARPILQTRPEVTTGKADPGVLNGRVALYQVSFRYDADGPLVLDGITLDAKPGEMVAIVGPSGAGKSTIVRMLLGFEEPVKGGGVYYDGQDLRTLNVQAVRRQIGVVLQNGKVTPGTVLDNIVGTSLLSEDDAWEAARIAGLANDIKQMPMGMYTMIAEGGSTFSGGQMQRLMIARAVVGHPRYLIFDEATSALDNETQSIVSENLDGLQVTRIVIAHRLSTIVAADRIFVIQDGKVVQSGPYAELMAQPGLFHELAKRQLA